MKSLLRILVALLPAVASAQSGLAIYNQYSPQWFTPGGLFSAVNAQTGATYTLTLTDANNLVTMNNAGANTVTIPTNASVAFPVGTFIRVEQIGAGVTSIVAAGGVTITNSTGALITTGGQYGQITLRKTATNTWNVDNTFSNIQLTYNGVAPANEKLTQTYIDSSGNFNIAALSDAGVIQANNFFQLNRSAANKFSGFTYKDTSGPAGETFLMAGQDVSFEADNAAPRFIMLDAGGTAASVSAGFQPSINGGTENAYFNCTMINQLFGGPTTDNCMIGTGNLYWSDLTSIPFSVGVGQFEYERWDPNALTHTSYLPISASATRQYALASVSGAVITYTIGDNVNANSATNIVSGATGGVKINGTPIKGTLSGTSGSIGGGALLAGACASGTTTVTGATTSMVALADPNTYPGDGTIWDAQVTSTNTVTTKVCAIIALTPTASTYNIRVIQ